MEVVLAKRLTVVLAVAMALHYLIVSIAGPHVSAVTRSAIMCCTIRHAIAAELYAAAVVAPIPKLPT
jgi:hypothetical protein